MTLDPTTTTEAPDAPDAPDASAAAAVGPRIYGVIDVLRPDRIAGWAIDRSDSRAALDVDILRDGARVNTVRADRHRPDLEKGGIGTGAYGFRAEIEPPLEAGFEFTLAVVARAPDGSSAELKRVGSAVPAPDPATRLMERIYETVTRATAASERPDIVAAPVATPVASPVGGARMIEALERIETVQARIEAALAALDAPAAPARDRSLAAIVFVTLAIAVVSIGLGVYSLTGP